MTKYTRKQVAEHKTEEDCYLIIGNIKSGGKKVYDVTKYLNEHPGGAEVLLDLAGQDADDMFEDIGHSLEARNKMKDFYIGELEELPGCETKGSQPTGTTANKSESSSNFALIAVIGVILALIAFFAISN